MTDIAVNLVTDTTQVLEQLQVAQEIINFGAVLQQNKGTLLSALVLQDAILLSTLDKEFMSYKYCKEYGKSLPDYLQIAKKHRNKMKSIKRKRVKVAMLLKALKGL